MVETVGLNISQLDAASSFDSFQELSQQTAEQISRLDRESRGMVQDAPFAPNSLEGPARNAELNYSDMMASFERTSETAMRLNENLVRFSALSSTLTSFGNNLNSFLKGQ